jgi:hypothetical protein
MLSTVTVTFDADLELLAPAVPVSISAVKIPFSSGALWKEVAVCSVCTQGRGAASPPEGRVDRNYLEFCKRDLCTLTI